MALTISETTSKDSAASKSKSRYGSPGLLVFFLVLIVLAGWVITNRSFRGIGLGVGNSSAPVSSVWSADPPAEVIVPDSQVGTVELPGDYPGSVRQSPIINETSPVILPTAPQLRRGRRNVWRGRGLDAVVTGSEVNMRSHPSFNSNVNLVLPQGWRVRVMNQTHVDNYGEEWVQVGLQTDRGFETGWINDRYLALVG